MLGPESNIVITARHFANIAPNFLYSSNLSRKPSKPSVTFSPACPANSFAPASTFIPGIIPLSDKYFGKGISLNVVCFIVSSKSIAPLIKSLRPGVVTSMSRYTLRFSSVVGMLSFSKRLLHVGWLSSIAKIPLPRATILFAVSDNISSFIFLPHNLRLS